MNIPYLQFGSVIVFTYYVLCYSYSYDTQFAIDFFKYNEIYFVNFHRCFGTIGTATMLKELYKNNIRSNVNIPMMPFRHHDYFHHRFGFATSVMCKNWNLFLREELRNTKYRIQKHGLIFCDSYEQYEAVKERLDKFDFKLDSNVYIVVNTNTSYAIYELYNVLPSSKRIFTNTGHYSNGKLEFGRLSRYEKRRDFGNVFLKVAFVVTRNVVNPEIYLSDQHTKQFDTSSKVNFGLFHHTVDVHNFRYTIVPTPGWFSSTRQGIEAGLGHAISTGIADISGSSGLMTMGRLEAFDFLVGTFLFRTCFFYRNLGANGVVYNEFIKPFSTGVWMCTVAFIALLSFIFLAMQFVEHRIHKNINVYSIYSILFYVLSAFCQQGIAMKNSSITSRSVVLTLSLLSFLWYNYYTSSIVSALINNKHEIFKDVETLINSDLKIGIENIAFKRIFNATNHPTLAHLQNLAAENNSKVGFYPQVEGIANVQKMRFAYLAEAIGAYSYISKTFDNEKICDLNELEPMRSTTLYLVGRKHGPFNEMLSVTRFLQYGLIQRQNKIFCDEKPPCLSTVQFAQVGIEQAAPAFILLLLGCIISIILLIFEKVFTK